LTFPGQTVSREFSGHKSGSRGIALIEVIVALTICALAVPCLALVLSSYMSEFNTSGFVTVGSQQIPYAPSPSQMVIAESMMAMLREDMLSSATVVGVNAEVSASYTGSSGVLTPVLAASPTQLISPTSAYTLLSAAGVPFTANNGFTVFVLDKSALIIAIYACNYQDVSGTRTYNVRRQGPTNQPLLSYTFAEPTAEVQPPPGISLGVSGADPVNYMVVRFPDPADPLLDQLNRLQIIANGAQRSAAQAALRRSAQYVAYVQFRQ
jgi:hypothetical protein